MLVIGVDERVSKVLTLLTSPLAVQSPAPSLPPFPCFAHPHHVIPLNGPAYRETFPEAPGGPEDIEAGSILENHTVQQLLGLPSNFLVPMNGVAHSGSNQH
jgi:hypothetical protein